jgi:antitoxin (DNA-binding transcriptional repressor) of toxin-antitoxin stability system
MKIDTLAHVKNQISAVIDRLGAEPLFITRNGKVAAVLQAVNDADVEDYLFRNSPRFWRLMQSRKSQAVKGATLPFDASRYGADDSRAAKDMAVREGRADYVARKKRKA